MFGWKMGKKGVLFLQALKWVSFFMMENSRSANATTLMQVYEEQGLHALQKIAEKMMIITWNETAVECITPRPEERVSKLFQTKYKKDCMIASIFWKVFDSWFLISSHHWI